MTKKLLTGMALCLASAATIQAQSACNGLRYRDFVFQDTTISNIVYGSNQSFNNSNTSLRLDVHMPKNDTVTNRPLIILAHGGNFLSGSKTGGDVIQFCNDLSQMGYVVASIDYRVGMTNFPFPGPDSTDATEAVMRAVQDAKAAVRFFKKDYATQGNTYGVDTANIYFMGVSAGGFMALHVAYLDEPNEFPSWADTTNQPGLSGGIEGNSGNPGYSSNVRAVINIAGALGDTAWINSGDEPVLNFHGTADQTVPYGSATIVLLGTYPLLTVHGSASIDTRVDQLGITNCFEIHEGQGHVPHVSSAAYYDTTLVITRNFLVHFICGDQLDCGWSNPIGMQELPALRSVLDVYPNPATAEFTVNTGRLAGNDYSIEVYDATGKLFRRQRAEADGTTTLTTQGWVSGMYMITVRNATQQYTQRVIVK
jgi:para-nitrobenzyl esterase